ncbi:NACHT domain-containing protein [bacterium]|nr:MAG: NACHT domain-containing protein [bacterium]
MMQECRIRLLGRLQFERGNQSHTRFRTQKTASLLAYLALHPGQQPRELLAGLIWPDDAPEAGRHSLRTAFSSLRQQLETPQSASDGGSDDLFESNRFALGLKSGTFSTDVGDFDAAIRGVHRASNDDERAQWYSKAVALYEGPFLPGFYDDWCLSNATRLQGAFEEALVFLATWHHERGESELARDYERRAVAAGISLPVTEITHKPVEKASPKINRSKESEILAAAQIELPSTSEKTLIPALATLLAFDGMELTSELHKVLLTNNGQQLPELNSETSAQWAFSGATGALQSAAILHQHNGQSLRIALCTGETQLAATERPTPTQKRAGLRERAMGMLESAQPGQTLCCESTMLLLRDQPTIESQDMGLFHLPGLRPGITPERIFQLKWRDEAPRDFAPLRAVKSHGALIPQPLTRFFGRDDELTTLRDLLSRERLVTLSGTAGSGKTRLALQIAHALDSSSEKTVFWVPLADVTRSGAIADTILDSLRVKRHNALSTFESIVQELNRDSSQSVLLLLDNFEHLVEGGVELLESLLAKAPRLQALVTSRRVLGIPGEVELPLAPLSIPANGSTPITPQSLENQPSVRLFCDRARLVRPDFALTAQNAASIAELCRQLEGIPLALELAAARAGSLSPARILERLQAQRGTTPEEGGFERFDFLQTASRTTPARHRTLRAALDWSFEALEPELQSVFSRLWVFRGGFTMEAAGEVGDTANALDALEELRVRSLLFFRINEEEPRFRMLETVRQYAMERAHQRGEVDETRRRHATYFLKWAQAEAPHAIGPDATARLNSWNRVRDEAANLRIALVWATEHAPEIALQLAIACHNFTGVHLSEREMNVERALQSVEHQKNNEVPLALLVSGLGLAATHASNRGDVPKQTEFSRRRLELMRDAPKPESRAWAMFDWGCARRNSGHFAESRESLEYSRSIFEQAVPPRRFQLLGWTLIELGLTEFYAGEMEAAKRAFRGCEMAFQQSGDRDGEASAKALFADILFHQGQLAEAQQIWPEVLRIERELGDEREHPWRRHQEGNLAVAQGDLGRGHDLLRRGLRAFWMDGHRVGAVRSLMGLAGFWLASKQPERALHLLRVENAERISAGWPSHEGWQPLRNSIRRAACEAKVKPTTEAEAELSAEQFELAAVIESELRGFE